ncbi:MAG: SDR family oxidoreductase [Candidatus Lambdaproteobacteria bacterium]|nr:SDR family oxidoreductase [Candidatus Lambdaproteobacteria bacterium]
MSMEGKVAVITGAARGLGAAFAQELSGMGMAVVVCDVRDCDETAAAVKKSGGKALSSKVDVTSAESAQVMAAAAVKAFGRIDVLVNNAAMYGNLHNGRFTDLDEQEWDACMAVNVKGLWQCAKACVPSMREQGGGSVINISSLAAIFGMPNALHYATSKGAVIGFTRALARELGRDNIRVNAIAPSMVWTPGTREIMGNQVDRFAEVVRNGQTLRRNLETDDLVGTVAYLAGDMSKFVTGQTIMVDGGTVYL